MPQVKHRLTAHVKPLQYHLKIQPNLADFNFVGTEVVRLEIAKPTKTIVLHAAELSVQSAKVVVGNITHIAKISYQSKAETVTFTFSKSFKGKARLYIEFTGLIGEQLRGFYRSKYLHQGKEKYLATSQFEATDARRFMPCFDEPAHKAKFILEVIIPKHLQVVSNTVEQSTHPHEPGYKIVRFAPTPKMSTYLLALIIGELEHLQAKSKRGVLIRVHTTPGKKAQAKFALEFTKRALDYLENYFGIPYPLPVLDLLAIPDFSAGAMENWGAITFRETLLLVDDVHSPFSQKQRVAEVIAHELVHQWFGNLVTMEWWTHLWLNESFATYMAYHVVDALHPDWRYWTKFALDEQAFALQQDSLHATHPIEVPVKHPNEIAEIFDAISYAKGATVLRMLAGFIGPDNFQAGLSTYLKKHSYKNTSSIHLWEAFEKASGLPVRKIMKVWTTKSGFPVLSAKFKNDQLTLTQTGFKQLSKHQSNQIWPIPLSIQTTKTKVGEPILISKPRVKIAVSKDLDFINLDYGDTSLTVIHYDIGLLARLLPKLQDKSLCTLDRLALIRDGFLLAKAGLLPSEVYLETLQFLEEETSFVVWSEVAKNLAQLERMLAGTSAESGLKKFQQRLFSQVLANKIVGLKPKANESQNIALLRGLAVLVAGISGNRAVIKTALQRFERGTKRLNPNLRSAVYTTTAKHGSTSQVEKLFEIYSTSDLAIEKQQILFALINGCQEKHQTKVLNLIYGTQVRDQDRAFAVAASLLNPALKTKGWDRLVANWPMLAKKYASTKMTGTLLAGAQSFNTSQEAAKLHKFLKGKQLPAAKQAIAQTLEKIQINLAWKARDQKALSRYFRQV